MLKDQFPEAMPHRHPWHNQECTLSACHRRALTRENVNCQAARHLPPAPKNQCRGCTECQCADAHPGDFCNCGGYCPCDSDCQCACPSPEDQCFPQDYEETWPACVAAGLGHSRCAVKNDIETQYREWQTAMRRAGRGLEIADGLVPDWRLTLPPAASPHVAGMQVKLLDSLPEADRLVREILDALGVDYERLTPEHLATQGAFAGEQTARLGQLKTAARLVLDALGGGHPASRNTWKPFMEAVSRELSLRLS